MKTTNIPHINTPHNDLFLRVFSRKDKATAFLKKCLPIWVSEMIDLTKLERVESKHISDIGGSLYNDIIYRCPFKDNKPGYYYFIIEHQSRPDSKMALRLLKYDTAVIEAHLKQGYTTFPVPINIVFHTGSRRWKHSTSFDENYDYPKIGSYYLHLAKFSLIQLPVSKEDPAYTDKDLGYCYAAFHCGRKRKKAYEEFKKFKQIPAFRDYFDNLPIEERILAGTYIGIFVSGSKKELENLVTLMITNEQEQEEIMRSIAQQYEEIGIEKGIENVAKNMLLELHLDIDTVQKATKLNKETIQNLLKEVKGVKASYT
jgi:hypothetical protein